ncbi:cation:H+ antiporter [Arthrobacter sp. PL16]|nr:cation:H+ antiporter [Arthrobacter sp. PL16]
MVYMITFILGAALLIYAADKLVSHLVGAARGLTVSVFLLAIIFTGIEFDDVALGVVLNLEDMDGVAVGIVFGTTVSYSGIVLAIAAIVAPTRVSIPRDYLGIFALSPLILIPFLLTGPMTIVHGFILVGLFLVFLTYVVVRESRANRPVFRDAEMFEAYEMARTPGSQAASSTDTLTLTRGEGGASPSQSSKFFTKKMPFPEANRRVGLPALALAALALVGLILGAYLVAEGTGGILEDLGMEATVFGATIATLVLTLEDLYLTVRPAMKGAPEIGIANLIGSAVFSVTAKLGVLLLFGSVIVDPQVFTWHLPALTLMTWVATYFLWTGHLRRWHGFVLLGLYIVYWTVTFFGFGEIPVEMD